MDEGCEFVLVESELKTAAAARASSVASANAAAFGVGANASPQAFADSPQALTEDAASRQDEAAPACPECRAEFVGDYCHACGEKRPEARDLSIRHFVHDAAKELTSLDSKLYHTLLALLFRPGRLTLEWVAGRRSRYLKPLNLCLAIFAVQIFAFTATKQASMFNIAMIVENEKQMSEQMHLPNGGVYARLFSRASARKGASVESLEDAVNEKWQRNVSLLQPLQILVLAVLLQLFYLLSRRYFVEHLVFSMHFLAFSSLTTTLMWPIYYFLGIAPTRYNLLVAAFKFLLDIFYMFVALRAVYRGSHAFAVLRAFVLFCGYFVTYIFVYMVSLIAAMFAVLR
ncbi:MAG TPA: DUF3667 domain-containing protein [Pyrinomonadaceae bacterium]|nr:DUF3667 domain-containing protein [Pyrinomonadaceae bacterium]